jgi:glycosyltransferase involved in cell wall biosynthesis
MISILILTLNEEANIKACLDCVAWSDDVVVLDSGSTDATAEIARNAGARVVTRPFDNWASHQNWAVAHIEFRNKWVFYLDADERMTPDLEREIRSIAADPGEARKGFYCGRINYFMGRPITRCYPPVPILRFFQPGHIRYERLVNPVATLDGPAGALANRFIHYNFSKGLTEWLDKHNKYALAEAIEAIKVLENPEKSPSLRSGDAALRRVAIKNAALRVPCRPLVKFIYLYLWRRGILDGSPGLTYCILQSVYEYLIDLKIREVRLNRAGIQL